jgi:ABC-2 type transport system ATP-binding protein
LLKNFIFLLYSSSNIWRINKLIDVKLESVYKYYGTKKALDNLSLEVSSGEVFCVVGPNGAGKTTMLRIIATLMRPSSGDVYICGEKIDYKDPKNLEKIRSMISYLPEDADTYSRLTGYEYLRFFADLYGVDPDNLRFGIEITGLEDDVLRKKTGTYSKGMRRRLLIARTLMVMPKIAILDEPTSGLDVFSAVSIRRVVRDFSLKMKKTIILSTHNMLEAQDLCDTIALIYNGKIIFRGRPEEAMKNTFSSNLEEAFVKIVEERRYVS